MREPLSLFGWILIIFLVLLILSVNLSLFLGRDKTRDQGKWVSRIAAAGREMKDPFHKEDEKLSELASRVQKLKIIGTQKINSLGEQNED